LIGDHGAYVDVDSNEVRSTRGGDSQGGSRVVSQDVDPESSLGPGVLYREYGSGEGGDRPWGDLIGRKGSVAKVLYDDPIGSAITQCARVVLGPP
jgi:hypothetical protein